MNEQTKADYVVTPLAVRNGSQKSECFYCRQPVGSAHKHTCVLIKKKVRVRMIVEYDIEVPCDWDDYMVEFSRNDGSWCADNAIDELRELSESEGCLCGVTRYEYIRDTSEGYLMEQ